MYELNDRLYSEIPSLTPADGDTPVLALEVLIPIPPREPHELT